MPIQLNPGGDNHHSYPIDISHPAEWARLAMQDDLLTQAMGGELAEQTDHEHIHDVLDIASGSGGWGLRTVETYPHMQIVGLDISRHMVEQANSAATAMGIADRVHFAVADILSPLPFPDDTFDLVNARFISTFLSLEGWKELITEAKRVLRKGGVLRLTEPEIGYTTAPNLEYLNQCMVNAFVEQGCGLSPQKRHMGVLVLLPSLLREASFQDVSLTAHVLEYSYGTPAHEFIKQNMEVGYKLMQPYFVRYGHLTDEEFAEKYTRALLEMQQPDFRGIWLYTTSWGKKEGE